MMYCHFQTGMHNFQPEELERFFVAVAAKAVILVEKAFPTSFILKVDDLRLKFIG